MTVTLRLEFRKLRRTRLWLTIGTLLAFELAWVTVALTRTFAQHGDIARDSGVVLGQVLQLHGLFGPLLVAIVASRLSALEHEARMVPRLFALNQSRPSLFRAKFATLLLVTLGYTAVGGAWLVGFGAMTGVTAQWKPIGIFVVGLVAANLAPIAIHLLLALVTTRQVVTLGVGILGGVAGTFVSFVPHAVSLAVPWHYYGVVNPVRMVVDDGSLTGFAPVEGIEWTVAVVAAVGAAVFLVALGIYERVARE
ncbi:ABC transporter permease [Halostreptopolyspora alba]|uniref:ABC transporter permease n=1 Tax=Halostreptopolyspora alba TaxID=2487137 RepID=A0A3N0E2Z1_9ACTN|nr:hypothetical protein EFW17_20105 [Nocardiopsaceae bacterium YIM 96095]